MEHNGYLRKPNVRKPNSKCFYFQGLYNGDYNIDYEVVQPCCEVTNHYDIL